MTEVPVSKPPLPLDMSLTQLCPWPGSHLWGQLQGERISGWMIWRQGSLSKLGSEYHGSWADLICEHLP